MSSGEEHIFGQAFESDSDREIDELLSDTHKVKVDLEVEGDNENEEVKPSCVQGYNG